LFLNCKKDVNIKHKIRTFIHLVAKYILSHRIWRYGIGIAILSGICILTFHLYKKITRTPEWHYTIELEKSDNIRIDSVGIEFIFPSMWKNTRQERKEKSPEKEGIPPDNYLNLKFTYGVRGNKIMESRPYKFYLSDQWILEGVYGYTKQKITFENNIKASVKKKSTLTKSKQYGTSIWHYDKTESTNPTTSQNMSQFIDLGYTLYREKANQYKDYFEICNETYLSYPLNMWAPYDMSKICLRINFNGTLIKDRCKSIDIKFGVPVELTNTHPMPEDNTFSEIRYAQPAKSWKKISQNGISTIVNFISYTPLQESRVFILTTIITLCISGIITLIIRLAYFYIKSINAWHIPK